MSVESNKAIAQRFVDEVVNGGNLDLVDELVAADFVEHEALPGMPTTGPEAPKAALGMFQSAFGDLQMTAEAMIGEGDTVVVRGTMSGTHTGDFMGIPPTNKGFEVNYIDVIEFRDGMATAHWGVTDVAMLMQQLGLGPGL